MFTSAFNAGNADCLEMKRLDVDKINVDFSFHPSLRCLSSEFALLNSATAMRRNTIFFTAFVFDNDTDVCNLIRV